MATCSTDELGKIPSEEWVGYIAISALPLEKWENGCRFFIHIGLVSGLTIPMQLKKLIQKVLC